MPVRKLVTYKDGNGKEYDIPSDANFLLFRSPIDFWIKLGDNTVTIPTADVTDGSSPELNPGMIRVKGFKSNRPDYTKIHLRASGPGPVNIIPFS